MKSPANFGRNCKGFAEYELFTMSFVFGSEDYFFTALQYRNLAND